MCYQNRRAVGDMCWIRDEAIVRRNVIASAKQLYEQTQIEYFNRRELQRKRITNLYTGSICHFTDYIVKSGIRRGLSVNSLGFRIMGRLEICRAHAASIIWSIIDHVRDFAASICFGEQGLSTNEGQLHGRLHFSDLVRCH